MKKLFKLISLLLLAVVLAAVGLVVYLTAAEYKPDDVEQAAINRAARADIARRGEIIKLVSFNTGYAGLDRSQDFFMDGGARSQPESREEVEENLAAMLGVMSLEKAQVYFLQEVDKDSARSFYIDQTDYYYHGLSLSSMFAYNYNCDYVPVPWPPMGKVKAGLLTLTSLGVTEATRESLPVPFSWPMRTVNLKRCLLISRVPVEGTQAELVLINLHMEAYDDGEGKLKQTRQLMRILEVERRNGNYVIAGGDFNQTFEDIEISPATAEGGWKPAKLSESELPQGFSYVFDADTPSCRSLRTPYDGDRANTDFYIIDGFIVSDNIKVNNIETVDLNFRNSDHNPVSLQATLI